MDHMGDLSLFLLSTSLIVGPRIKLDLMTYPGYPKNPDALMVQDGFKGCQVVELDFSKSQLKVCRLHAIDWFNNGSFYLLEAPGHTNDHVMALACTAEEKFVLFGGDTACKFCPMPLLPLPESISPSLFKSPKSPAPPSFCLCSIFEPIHPLADPKSTFWTTPFYEPAPVMAYKTPCVCAIIANCYIHLLLPCTFLLVRDCELLSTRCLNPPGFLNPFDPTNP